MDDQSNNGAFEPTEPLKDDATTSRVEEIFDPPRPAPTPTEVTKSRHPDPRPRTSGDETGGQRSGRVQEIAIDEIIVPPKKRSLKEETVEQIMTSAPEFGLGGTPVTVYRGEEAEKFVLITGGHKLEAARRLGWTAIVANIVEWDADQRRMWEIIENLHRAELTELERADQFAELTELRERRAQKDQILDEANKLSQVETVLRGGRGKKGGIRAAARELGITKDDAHRSIKIAGLSEPAKQVARETGLDDNRTVLLKAAKAKDGVKFLREERKSRDTKKKAGPDLTPNIAQETPNLDLTPNRAGEYAGFLMAHVKPKHIPLAISLIKATKPDDVIEVLQARNLYPAVLQKLRLFKGADDQSQRFRREVSGYRDGEEKDEKLIIEVENSINKLSDINEAMKWYEQWFIIANDRLGGKEGNYT